MKRMRILMIAAIILIACYVACCMAVDDVHILPNTVVNGMDISGMDSKEAIALLENDAESRCPGSCNNGFF